MANGFSENGTASDVTKPIRAGAARAANAADDAVSMAEDGLDSLTAAGLPERKYSFNALIAMGVTGFVIGKIFAR